MKQLKITKLFHWLYALLMLAPCFSVLFTCLYVAFNKNAYESYSGATSHTYYEKVEYQTNEVNSIDDLVVGNVYFIIITSNRMNYHTNVDWYVIGDTTNFDLLVEDTLYNNVISSNTFKVAMRQNNVTLGILLTQSSNPNVNVSPYLSFSSYGSGFNITIPFVYLGNENNMVVDDIQNFVTIADLDLVPPQYEVVDEVETSTLDNVFYYSLDKVATSDIFGWARYSFIAQPFSYITSLFGMSADNPLNIYFSYWASISIIWLVFDIVLYVPLLAHKWLDEGGI